MCVDCLWEKELQEIERRLVNSFYAPYAAELMTLSSGIKERTHIGDAASYRLEDIDVMVKQEMLKG